MATIETEMTIKVCEVEILALQKLLAFQYHNPSDAGMKDSEKDLLNNIFFRVNEAVNK